MFTYLRVVLLSLFVLPLCAIGLLIPFINILVVIKVLNLLWVNRVALVVKNERLVATQLVKNTKNGRN